MPHELTACPQPRTCPSVRLQAEMCADPAFSGYQPGRLPARTAPSTGHMEKFSLNQSGSILAQVMDAREFMYLRIFIEPPLCERPTLGAGCAVTLLNVTTIKIFCVQDGL